MASVPVSVGSATFGSDRFVVIAGPCSIESTEQLMTTARGVASAGAVMLRGGVFKLRTDPRSFQGLGHAALEAVAEARRGTGLPFVTEITDPRQIEPLYDAVDMFQVGSRNMHNYELLKELGRSRKPVLLKRGLSALVDEWLLAARYITDEGNPSVVLCERGIRTFERVTRNTLDLSAVVYAKLHSPYPVIVDPSHAAGRRDLIPGLCYAAAAAGADGLILEVHPEPHKALSDAEQALDLEAFHTIMNRLRSLTATLGRALLEEQR